MWDKRVIIFRLITYLYFFQKDVRQVNKYVELALVLDQAMVSLTSLAFFSFKNTFKPPSSDCLWDHWKLAVWIFSAQPEGSQKGL